MSETTSNNKRIAKNTLFLYFRMLVMMVVSLYTSRVILNALGVEDYGIYNVVGGVVSMFTILSSSLSAAISRFITFELGRGEKQKLHNVFCTAINVQVALVVIITIILETVGLWFLNNKMVIPENRIIAANWVFQISVITFVINLLSVPYNASIIAHEKMSAFAYISLFEASAKLLIAFLVMANPFDRLIYYAALICIVGIIIRFIYAWYCRKNFEECHYRPIFNKELTLEMFNFAGWNFFGAGSWQLMTQGVNLLLNVYFGVTVNAARGIANQIDSAVMQFVNNFTTAINPQITKSYASGNRKYMFSLMFRGAKFSYFLMLFFAIPIICETDYILNIWLGLVPDYAITFARLALIVSMIHVLSNTMITAMLATGDIKKYQLIVGGLGMLVFPLAWLFFYIGLPPETAYAATILIFICQLICRLKLLKDMIGMSPVSYIKEVLVKVVVVTVFSFAIPILLTYSMQDCFWRFFSVGIVGVISCITCIWYIGLDSTERDFLALFINRIKSKFIK